MYCCRNSRATNRCNNVDERIVYSVPLPQQLTSRTPQHHCAGAAAATGGRNASNRANRSPRTNPRTGTPQDAQNLPSLTPSTIHQDVRDLSAGLETMVGAGGRWSRPPVLSPGGSATANHLTRHDAHNHVSRRLRDF